MRYRPERIANLIKEELNKIISRELEFPNCLVTLTGVEVDKKLERAVVNFSVLSFCQGCPFEPNEKCVEGTPQNAESVLKILEKNQPRLQRLLAKRINIKSMPKIIFRIDYGPEKAAEIEKILLEDKINRNTD